MASFWVLLLEDLEGETVDHSLPSNGDGMAGTLKAKHANGMRGEGRGREERRGEERED
jgi:hypothetical protein